MEDAGVNAAKDALLTTVPCITGTNWVPLLHLYNENLPSGKRGHYSRGEQKNVRSTKMNNVRSVQHSVF